MWHLNPLGYSLLPLWCLPICKNQHHSSSQTEHIGDSTMGITFSIPQVYLSIPMWIDWIKWKCICVYLNTSKKNSTFLRYSWLGHTWPHPPRILLLEGASLCGRWEEGFSHSKKMCMSLWIIELILERNCSLNFLGDNFLANKSSCQPEKQSVLGTGPTANFGPLPKGALLTQF